MYPVNSLFVSAANYSAPLDLWIENAPPREVEGRQEAARRIRNFVETPDAYSLDLSGLRLSKLPPELFKLPALIERLTTLDLSNNPAELSTH